LSGWGKRLIPGRDQGNSGGRGERKHGRIVSKAEVRREK
jgi:hypothetical protein